MPTYEYQCRNCGHNFDKVQSFNDAPITLCPNCGQEQIFRVVGASGVIFKGSGFYINDSKRGDSAARNSKTDSKSESGSDNGSDKGSDNSGGKGSDKSGDKGSDNSGDKANGKNNGKTETPAKEAKPAETSVRESTDTSSSKESTKQAV